MKVTAEMKIKEVLKINPKMLDAFVWLAPEFGRLRNKTLRKAMSGRVNISQAARIAKIPLTEALYVLNLAAGEDEKSVSRELLLLPREAFETAESNGVHKPAELEGVFDNDLNVHFVDVTLEAGQEEDPMPKILRGLAEMNSEHDILLIRHPFDPVPLRDLLARNEGLTSWAEERSAGDWFIYFYRNGALAASATAYPSFRKREAGNAEASILG